MVAENPIVTQLIRGEKPSREDLKRFLNWHISTLDEEEEESLSFDEAIQMLKFEAQAVLHRAEADAISDGNYDDIVEEVVEGQDDEAVADLHAQMMRAHKALIIAVEQWQAS